MSFQMKKLMTRFVKEKCESTGLKRKILTKQDLILEKLQSIRRSSEKSDIQVQKMNCSTEKAQGSRFIDVASTSSQQEA
jgi:hypothetical protein